MPEGCVEIEAGQGSQITSPSLVLCCNALLCALCDVARSEQITTTISDAPDHHFLLPVLPNPSIVPGRKANGPPSLAPYICFRELRVRRITSLIHVVWL
jgi:hypothetical protein